MFSRANLAGAVIWGAGYVVAGFLVGQAYRRFEHSASTVGEVIIGGRRRRPRRRAIVHPAGAERPAGVAQFLTQQVDYCRRRRYSPHTTEITQ